MEIARQNKLRQDMDEEFEKEREELKNKSTCILWPIYDVNPRSLIYLYEILRNNFVFLLKVANEGKDEATIEAALVELTTQHQARKQVWAILLYIRQKEPILVHQWTHVDLYINGHMWT